MGESVEHAGSNGGVRPEYVGPLCHCGRPLGHRGMHRGAKRASPTPRGQGGEPDPTKQTEVGIRFLESKLAAARAEVERLEGKLGVMQALLVQARSLGL